MELMTISQVSKAYGVSSRMLRYYEQVGLLKSLRNEENSYRVYDEDSIKRIQQIVILRKLQIPVKQIYVILENSDAIEVIEIFKENISQLEREISALTTIKSIMQNFVSKIEEITDIKLNLDLLNEDTIQKMLESLPLVQKNIKEKFNMDELNKATEVINKLKDVRVVYIPPMTIASIYMEGDSVDQELQMVNDFVMENDLLTLKPDLRFFIIEHNLANGHKFGNEVWLSIPDDLNVPDPFVKKKFHGGQYASHLLRDDGMTYMGLQDWINESSEYQYDGDLARCEPPIEEIDGFGGMRLDLEELLNYYNDQSFSSIDRMDVLMPIKNYVLSEELSDDKPVEIPGSKEKCGFHASIITKNKFDIIGFTKIMIYGGTNDTNGFENELVNDGRLDILNKYRKPGAPILCYGSDDMDSRIRGGWRYTVCLAESDITDVQEFMKHNPYVETIDNSRWLIFKLTDGRVFDDHGMCGKLGYTWNSVISGTITVIPDGKFEVQESDDEVKVKRIFYSWYPVK